VWEREGLSSRFATRGPALILEAGSTLWVPKRWRARMHPSGTLVLTRGRS